MARKESDGTKFSKKSREKNNKKHNIYSQKVSRLKTALLEKRMKDPVT